LILALLLACARPEAPPPVQALRSTWGHAGERDLRALLQSRPDLRGGRLDDCALCHGGGPDCPAFGQPAAPPANPCDFCHRRAHPSAELPGPAAFRETLNAFGLRWADGGRGPEALDGPADSDGDGCDDRDELASGHFPGDPASHPGLLPAPLRRFDLRALSALPVVEQLMLSNATSAAEDGYARWRGVRLRDLLVAAGVSPDDPGIAGVTLVSPDGYRRGLTRAEALEAAPPARFYAGLDPASLGAECGFVRYPAVLQGLADGDPLPQAWTLLAWERDGAPLEPVALDPRTAKLSGEGPLRAAVPQRRPGPPDRGSKVSPSACGDGLDHDPEADHNAGAMVRGVVAVRVDPLPAGLEDLDWGRGGWAWLERGELLVYGRGVD
jgi:hypothetical protein